MARTIAEIYDALNQVKSNMPELGVYVNNDAQSIDTAKKLINDVRNASKVAVWRLWLWVVAVGSWVVESYMDVHEAKINAIIAEDKPHTLNWYKNETLKFQYGHEIVWLGDHFGYANINPDAQIVKYAAAMEVMVEPSPADITKVKVFIKAMKANYEVLSYEEINALKAFWNRWKDAGIVLEVYSEPIDRIILTIDVFRDRNILEADNTLIRDHSVNMLTDPANEFIKSVEFNGQINLTELIRHMKNQEGIREISFVNANCINGTFISSMDIWLLIPNSGVAYIDWDASSISYEDFYD